MKMRLFLSAAVLSLAAAGNAMAGTWSSVYALETSETLTSTASQTNAEVDNVVVDGILSLAGTYYASGGSATYGSSSFLVHDSTGGASLDAYGVLPTIYTPTVGDGLDLVGTYKPYHQIPELNMGATGANVESPTGSYPSPQGPLTGYSVSSFALQNVTTSGGTYAGLPPAFAGQLVTFSDVTISGSNAALLSNGLETGPGGSVAGLSFSNNQSGGNWQGTMSDGTGSMEFYYWPTSYSACYTGLAGTAIPTGLCDVTGFISVYTPTSGPADVEFTPISITPVPEPGTLALLAIGACALGLVWLRKRVRS